MKTLVLSLAAMIALGTAKAQFSENFDGAQNSLVGNCWTMTGVSVSNDVDIVINGTGSIYSNPPGGGPNTRDLVTPALVISNQSFTVSFNYKLSNPINSNTTRTIEVGLLDVANNFTSLYFITLDKNSPATVQNFSQTFPLGFTGERKLIIKSGGTPGEGNSRLVFDDIATNASPKYGTGTCNTAPVAIDDAFSGLIGSVITGNVMGNDNDPDSESISSAVVTTSPDGTVVLGSNGNFTFTPSPTFAGVQTTFTYQLTDNGFAPVNSNVATVTINYFVNGALPVKLTSFTATLNNNKVDLKWTTATEINVSHYIVERSTDGRNFNQAGMIFANGNSSVSTNYASSDDISYTQSTVIYYRLRSVDNDGKTQLSETRIIRTSKQSAPIISVLTYPNPVNNQLNVTIPDNWQGKKATYEIFTISGQVAKRVETGSSSQTETINTSSMAPGFYMLRVSCDGQTAQQKIVKQ